MIEYRPFRNSDPPALVDVWNAAITGPRAVTLRTVTLFEYFTFAKIYFDYAGLVVATDNGKIVGFAHAAFGPNANGSGLDCTTGVICVLSVVPSHQRKGIGTQLLRRVEDYLQSRGATRIVFGSQAPLNPFLFGLHGGCTNVGVLNGETALMAFLTKQGYVPGRQVGIFQRSLQRFTIPNDPRFPKILEQYNIQNGWLRRPGWWRECVLGPVEAVEYRLVDKAKGMTAARLVLWDMETFGIHWNTPYVGVVDLVVELSLRRQGLAKCLMSTVLKHLRDKSFLHFEASADLNDAASAGLMKALEFTQAEAGTAYIKK